MVLKKKDTVMGGFQYKLIFFEECIKTRLEREPERS